MTSFLSFSFLAFGFGLLGGSLLQAWVLRTRSGKSIIKGRSFCPHCNAHIQWRDLIPVVSYFVLKMRCRSCQQKISSQYPLVESITALLFLLVFVIHVSVLDTFNLANFPLLPFLRDVVIVFFLEFVFIYDWLFGEIWDKTTLFPGFILFFLSLALGWRSWESMLLGILIGGGFFLLQFILSKGRWIGGGDIRLGFFMGVVLGFPLITIALFLAYIGGAIISVFLLLLGKKDRKSHIPFGVFLSTATFIIMFWGEDILQWYLSLLKS